MRAMKVLWRERERETGRCVRDFNLWVLVIRIIVTRPHHLGIAPSYFVITRRIQGYPDKLLALTHTNMSGYPESVEYPPCSNDGEISSMHLSARP